MRYSTKHYQLLEVGTDQLLGDWTQKRRWYKNTWEELYCYSHIYYNNFA